MLTNTCSKVSDRWDTRGCALNACSLAYLQRTTNNTGPAPADKHVQQGLWQVRHQRVCLECLLSRIPTKNNKQYWSCTCWQTRAARSLTGETPEGVPWMPALSHTYKEQQTILVLHLLTNTCSKVSDRWECLECLLSHIPTQDNEQCWSCSCWQTHVVRSPHRRLAHSHTYTTKHHPACFEHLCFHLTATVMTSYCCASLTCIL